MSIQIESIVLYNHEGEVRKLDFQLGAINIITGRSYRGKSAIIPIIEYCLGNSEFEVPGDAIRKTVAYYCVIYRIGDERFLVAKPPPPDGHNRQSRGIFIPNPQITPLDIDKLLPDTNDDEIRRHIGSLLQKARGTDQQVSVQKAIDRSRYFLFQKSTTILHDHLLFHRQESDTEQIRESLPFFLGIRQEDEIALARALDEAIKASEKAQRRLSEARRRLRDSVQHGQSLLQELHAIGILRAESMNIDATDILEMVSSLRTAITQWQPGQAPSITDQRLPSLHSQLKTAKESYVKTQLSIQAARSLQQDAAGYTEQVEEQRMRLQSIEVISNQNPFEFADSTVACPLCNSTLTEASIDIPKISAIRSSLEKLNVDLAAVRREQPAWNEMLDGLEVRLRSEQREIDRIQVEVTKVLRDAQTQENIFQEIVSANRRA